MGLCAMRHMRNDVMILPLYPSFQFDVLLFPRLDIFPQQSYLATTTTTTTALHFVGRGALSRFPNAGKHMVSTDLQPHRHY